jgi:hypothetical protein
VTLSATGAQHFFDCGGSDLLRECTSGPPGTAAENLVSSLTPERGSTRGLGLPSMIFLQRLDAVAGLFERGNSKSGGFGAA